MFEFTRQLSFIFRRKEQPELGLPAQESDPGELALKALESDEALKEFWIWIRREYFPARADIDRYQVRWSKRRQKRTLASCNFVECRVNVAKEMRRPEIIEYLEPLLYHEMCHAYMGKRVPRKRGKFQWHGEAFKRLEHRHPHMKQLDHWVKSGGWSRAVRSHRSREAAAKRKANS